MRVIIEPHFMAITESARAALIISEKLPDTDAVLELRSILSMQCEILTDVIDGKHFGSRALEQFTTYCQQTCNEMERYNDAT